MFAFDISVCEEVWIIKTVNLPYVEKLCKLKNPNLVANFTVN